MQAIKQSIGVLKSVFLTPTSSILWVFLGLSLLAPLAVAVAWGDVYTDTAYEQFRRAQAIATGQGWDFGGFSPLYTLLLALASALHLPLPPVAIALSVAGWMTAIAAWFFVGLALDRPTFSVAVAVLLALHPQQGRALGIESGLVLGLLGLTAWWTVRGRIRAALVATFILAASWNGLHWGASLLAVLDVLVAAGFAFLVPDFDWLAPSAASRRTLLRGFLLLGLVALALWQASTLAQDWRFRPTERLALYEALGRWLRDHTLPAETIAARDAGRLGYLSGRTSLALPDAGPVRELVQALERERPDYCIALNSLAWQGTRTQPWFQEHYEEVYRLASPYAASAPLTVFRYTPTPFDDGELVSTTATFTSGAGERIELTGYRLDSRRIIPGEPLHLTLYWHAVTPIYQPLLLTVRLVDPATETVWTQAENPAPGGLATDLWNAGARLDDRCTLLPPGGTPPGDYVLDVGFHLPNGRPLAVRAGDERAGQTAGQTVETRFVLTQVNHPPNVSTVPLTPDHPFHVTFGAEIELVGYDVTARVAPGETLRVTLYWRALQPVPFDYKVFVHLLGPGDQSVLLAQDDSQPAGWTYPTTRWRPGETIRDEHLLAIPSSAPRGDYRLVVGLYDSATGERPIVRDTAGSEIAGRRVTLRQIQVR
jgi:hypothetical protein